MRKNNGYKRSLVGKDKIRARVIHHCDLKNRISMISKICLELLNNVGGIRIQDLIEWDCVLIHMENFKGKYVTKI